MQRDGPYAPVPLFLFDVSFLCLKNPYDRWCVSDSFNTIHHFLWPRFHHLASPLSQKLSIDDFGVVELNEAFAAQAIACVRELKCDMDKTNPLGSGISIGHPIGCTGARILLTLMGEMLRKEHDRASSLCIGGGQGMATIIEKV